MEKKSFDSADRTDTPPKSKIEVVTVGGKTVTRVNFQPGWRWSECVGPTKGMKSCPVHHIYCVISGHLQVTMNDGTVADAIAGDVVEVPAGHDGRVVGDVAFVAIDMGGVASSN